MNREEIRVLKRFELKKIYDHINEKINGGLKTSVDRTVLLTWLAGFTNHLNLLYKLHLEDSKAMKRKMDLELNCNKALLALVENCTKDNVDETGEQIVLYEGFLETMKLLYENDHKRYNRNIEDLAILEKINLNLHEKIKQLKEND